MNIRRYLINAAHNYKTNNPYKKNFKFIRKQIDDKNHNEKRNLVFSRTTGKIWNSRHYSNEKQEGTIKKWNKQSWLTSNNIGITK